MCNFQIVEKDSEFGENFLIYSNVLFLIRCQLLYFYSVITQVAVLAARNQGGSHLSPSIEIPLRNGYWNLNFLTKITIFSYFFPHLKCRWSLFDFKKKSFFYLNVHS